MKITPKTLHVLALKPQGVFIATREEGGQGTGPGPKRHRGRSHTGAVRAALRAARCPFCPLSASGAGFWFCAPGFDE